MNAINRILVPTDLSDSNSNPLNDARQIAGRHGAKIDVIHVIPMWRYFNESLQKLGIPLDNNEDTYPHLQEQASTKVSELMDRHLDPETKGKAVVRISHNPARVITEYAERGQYDLIVMDKGKHNADLLGGNMTGKVIRNSDIPVLHTDSLDSEIDNVKEAVPALRKLTHIF